MVNDGLDSPLDTDLFTLDLGANSLTTFSEDPDKAGVINLKYIAYYTNFPVESLASQSFDYEIILLDCTASLINPSSLPDIVYRVNDPAVSYTFDEFEAFSRCRISWTYAASDISNP